MSKESVVSVHAQVARELRVLDASLDLLDASVAGWFGIGRTDLRAMELVSRGGPATCSQLAAELNVTTGSVTALIDRMERAGYFVRRYDSKDRRKVLVELTASGRERERRVFEPLARNSIAMLRHYSDADLRMIRDFLRKSRALVEQARKRVQGRRRTTSRRPQGRTTKRRGNA
jgi:DNA-binding MarR family transcriptional regulator